MSADPGIKPAIERPTPIINNPYDAFEDSLLRMERVLGTLASASADLMEQVVGSSHPEHAVARAHDIWLVLRTAEEGLEHLYGDFAAINDAMYLARREKAA